MSERMNGPPHDPMNDEDLAKHLGRDSEMSKRYRELGDDVVPAQLDQRILDLAREAVASKDATPVRRQRQWIRWSAPFALAASGLLVLSIVIQSGVQEEAAVRMQSPTPTPAAAPEEKAELREERIAHDASATSSALAGPQQEADLARAQALMDRQAAQKAAETAGGQAQPDVRGDEPRAVSERAEQIVVEEQRRRESVQDSPVSVAAVEEPAFAAAPPAAPAPSVAATRAAPQAQPQRRDAADSAAAAGAQADLEQVVITGQNRRAEAPRASGPRDTVRALSGAEAEAKRYANDAERDPEEWLEEIRDLRKKGRDRDADEQWMRFVDMHPRHVVEPADLARPAGERMN